MTKGQVVWIGLTVLVLIAVAVVLVRGDEEYFQYLPVINKAYPTITPTPHPQAPTFGYTELCCRPQPGDRAFITCNQEGATELYLNDVSVPVLANSTWWVMLPELPTTYTIRAVNEYGTTVMELVIPEGPTPTLTPSSTPTLVLPIPTATQQPPTPTPTATAASL